MQYIPAATLAFIFVFAATLLLLWAFDSEKYDGLPLMPPVALSLWRVPTSALPVVDRKWQLHKARHLIGRLSMTVDIWLESRDEIRQWLDQYNAAESDTEYLLKRAYLILLGVEYGNNTPYSSSSLDPNLATEVSDWLTDYLGSEDRVGETVFGRALRLSRLAIAASVGLIVAGSVILVISLIAEAAP